MSAIPATSDTTTATRADAILARLGGRQSSTASATDEMQNRFLTLLTTQLKNQDPLNPMDNAEVTSQLAQMSTVQGIENLNKMFQQFLDTNSVSELSALVGRGVLIEGERLELTQAGGVGGVELAQPADQVTVTLFDANGLPVRKLDLGALEAGTHNFVWDGRADDGQIAAPGTYRMVIEAKSNGDPVTAKALQLAQVTAVVRGPNGADLQLGSDGVYRLDEIKQVLS